MAALMEAISSTLPAPLKAPAKLAIATVIQEERNRKVMSLIYVADECDFS